MLKCAHFIKLMKFIALDQNISWSMRTKAKNLTFKLLQLNYYLWYSCMLKNIFLTHLKKYVEKFKLDMNLKKI